MKKLVIIPTYNEKENIKEITEAIFVQAIADLDILVIDDHSPDQTALIVKTLQLSNPRLFLLERTGKLGLGTAYIAGFKWAEQRGYDLVIEMDADFSHDPKYLAEIIKQAQTHDFVVGSRYVAGGGVANWPLRRRLISKLSSLVARCLLGISIKDFTGGFNAWRTTIFNKVNLDTIKSNGFSFQLEMKYQASRQGFSGVEVPIIFQDRQKGQSKLSKQIALEFFSLIWRLKKEYFLQPFKELSLAENKWQAFWQSRLVNYLYFLILLVLAGFFLFWNLGQRSLQNWDEAIYALMSHDLVQQPSLTLYLNNQLWFEKPPLGFFIEALSIAIFGFSEWAIRLPSSLYVFFSVILIYLLGKELFNKHLGFVAALLTLISPALIYDHMARSGDLDSGLLLFTVLAFYLLIKAQKNKAYLLWSGVAAGLGIMIRGSSGIFIILISALYLLLAGQIKKFSPAYRLTGLKDYFYYFLGLLIVTVPWHLEQLVVHGRVFWDIYVQEHFLSRIVTPIQNHAGAWDYYFMFFRWRHNLLHYLIWLSLFYSGWKIIIQRQKALLLPVLWLVITLVPMMIMQTKLWWYGITLIPAMMFLVCYFIFDLIKEKHYYLITGLNIFMVIVWLADKKINNYNYSFLQLIIWLVVIFSGAIIWAIINKFYFKSRLLVSFLVSFLILFFLAINLSFAWADYVFISQKRPDPIEQLAQELQQLENKGTNLVVYNTQYWVQGWILPQADYYLRQINKNQLFLIGEANLEYYIDRQEYQYFLTNQPGLEIMNIKANNNYSFTELVRNKDLILVKKTQKAQ